MKLPIKIFLVLFIFFVPCFLSPLAFSADILGSNHFDYGFFASRFPTVDGGECLRAAGPFFSRVRWPEGRNYLGVRPFYAKYAQPEKDFWTRLYLWPLAYDAQRDPEYRWRFLLSRYTCHDIYATNSPYHGEVALLYYYGRDHKGEKYHALFPIIGETRGILFMDKFRFFLFPIWWSGDIHRVHSRNFVWPFGYGETDGGGQKGRRYSLFYGYAEKTNDYRKRYVMWPFWTQARYYRPGFSGNCYVLWPLWGRVNMENQKGLMILPPFFRFNFGKRGDLVYAPWPFIQYQRGRVNKFYLWPLYGKRVIGSLDRRFFLWPFIWNYREDMGPSVRHKFQLVPFVVSEWTTMKTNAPSPYCYHRLWPLGSYLREGDQSRFVVLDLWPFRRYSAVNYTWAPLWSIYTRSRCGEARETEFLWGLYRSRRNVDTGYYSLFPLWQWERRPEERSWSFLKGLVGYEAAAGKRSLRLLYILRFGL